MRKLKSLHNPVQAPSAFDIPGYDHGKAQPVRISLALMANVDQGPCSVFELCFLCLLTFLGQNVKSRRTTSLLLTPSDAPDYGYPESGY